MAIQARKEIPWCTIFLVTGALVAHALVLQGNLATSAAMNTLGTSTGGWSGVGVTLSGSLHNELDMIMTNVTSVLTKAIKSINNVKTSLDAVLGLAGSVTDMSMSGYERGMGRNSSRQASLAQTEASTMKRLQLEMLADHSHRGPWAPYMGDMRKRAAAPASASAAAKKGSLLEQEVVFMGQLGQPVLNVLDPVEALVSSQDLEVEDPEQQTIVWNRRNVENLTTQVMTGALGLWKSAHDYAVVHKGANATTFPTPQEFSVALKASLKELVKQLTSKASVVLQKLFTIIKPALLQVGQWVVTFGTKVTDKIEGFMSSLDNVQKIFDQIMAKISQGAGEGKGQMMHESYNLFDASHTGYISVQDLKDVGNIYGINGLAGSSAERLFQTYDADRNGKMMRDEFSLFVDDTDVPNLMSTVLRYYSKRLSQIAGNVAAARYRDEVALAVMDYMALVCAKNMTKVGWVSDALTNRSLPHEFSADVLAQLALNLDNPDQITTVDVGGIIVKEMCRLNPTYVGQLLAEMTDPGYWTREGFDLVDQAKCVKRVTLWITNTPYASTVLAAQRKSLAHGNVLARHPTPPAPAPSPSSPSVVQVEVTSGGSSGVKEAAEAEEELEVEMTAEQIEAAPAMMYATVVERQKLYQRSRVIAMRLETLEKRETPTVKALKSQLGHISLLGVGTGSPAESAINKGVPARPETLRFAQYLSSNATATANMLVELCFDYSSESSSPLDSFAVQIKNMIKKAQNFISLLQDYAGPTGVRRLEEEINNFGNSAAQDIVAIIEPVIDEQVKKIMKKYRGADMSVGQVIEDVLRNWTGVANLTIPSSVIDAAQEAVPGLAVVQVEADSELGAPGEQSASEMISALGLGPIWSTLQYSLDLLMAALPQVVADLKFARKEVSAVSSTLDSIFTTFSSKGPPIFELVAKLYKMVWVAYFILFATLTSGILFYGLWASGFCGGPQAAANVEGEEWYERPQTFRDRCAICCRCCSGCLKGCADSHLCFWSFIIIFQIIVLVLFVVSIVLCLLAGIKAFIVAGCAEVYLLGDPTICTGTLGTVRTFLVSFLENSGIPLADTCDKQTLLTCQLIGSKMKSSAIFTTIGSLVAAVFSFQMIVESAVLHERARWRRIFDEESKRV